MVEEENLNPESFDTLLAWLDPDRESAWTKYETIRKTLIQIFTWRGCRNAEDLADETVNRVIKRLPDLIKKGYSGDKARYFYGVAKNVIHEYFRHEARYAELPENYLADKFNPDDEEIRLVKSCLDHCLQQLSEEDQELFLSYHQYDKKTKIKDRKQLAERMGMEIHQLRSKIFEIRLFLAGCIRGCVKQKGQAI